MGSQDYAKPHCSKSAVCSSMCRQNQAQDGARWLLGPTFLSVHTFIHACFVLSTVLIAKEIVLNGEGQGGQGNDISNYLNVIVVDTTEWKSMKVRK